MLRVWVGVLTFLSLSCLVATAVQQRTHAAVASVHDHTTHEHTESIISSSIAVWGATGVSADDLSSLNSSNLQASDTPVPTSAKLIPFHNEHIRRCLPSLHLWPVSSFHRPLHPHKDVEWHTRTARPAGCRNEWLLEVKLCLDSDLPDADTLPLHVLHQVLVQLECTQRMQAHVWFVKQDHPGRLIMVNYNSNTNYTTIITASGKLQEISGMWRDIHNKLAWLYFNQLAPELILQRAKLGAISVDLLPTATATGESKAAGLEAAVY